MKAKAIAVLIIALAFLCPARSEAQQQKFKKQKSYTKSYTITPTEKITLDNQFGEMKITTWSKNEIKVVISMAGLSTDEQLAQSILDRISIVDEKNSNGVSFKTVIGANKNQQTKKIKNSSEEIKVNYVVYMPQTNPLAAKNQFGDLIMPDYRGQVSLDSQFGSLTTGKLSNVKLVSVQFGKGDIGPVSNGRVDIKFSTVTIEEPVGNMEATFQHSTVKVLVNNQAQNLNINSQYTELYVDVNKALSASYKISPQNGKFTNSSNFDINKSGNRNEFIGKSGTGEAKINVQSSFGSVVLGHNLKVDMSKKKTTTTYGIL